MRTHLDSVGQVEQQQDEQAVPGIDANKKPKQGSTQGPHEAQDVEPGFEGNDSATWPWGCQQVDELEQEDEGQDEVRDKEDGGHNHPGHLYPRNGIWAGSTKKHTCMSQHEGGPGGDARTCSSCKYENGGDRG